jgi:hypothetical protein
MGETQRKVVYVSTKYDRKTYKWNKPKRMVVLYDKSLARKTGRNYAIYHALKRKNLLDEEISVGAVVKNKWR